MKFDAIVLGAGQAGGPLAYGLADKGWSVALVEREHLGGTCINTGCTPTKTMVASAQVAHYARNARKWGVHTEGVQVDLPAVIARKRKVVQDFRSGQERKAKSRPNIQLFCASGSFDGPGRVRVGEETLESDRIFLNLGTRAAIPSIPGIAESGYLTNASIMELEELPEHLFVLGGGYIGLEFGQMFLRFGSRVTLVHHGDQIVSREDEEVSKELQAALAAEGLRFEMNAKTTRVSRDAKGITLELQTPDGAKTVTGSHLLVVTGRTPNTEGLNAASAGIELDNRGNVKVNDRLETTAPGVWALGDVKGGPAFTHISFNDYQIVYGNLIEGKNLSTKDRIVPYAVYTDPQLGGVGMTEREARAAGRKLKIGKIPMTWVARAIERDETAGLMKIIVDAETDQILGASILGTEGGELVQIIHALMLAKAPYTLMKGAIYIHPTLAEGFWSLMDSVAPA